ncbi:hypothetical protein TNIN_492841 [Trichonephila inaurata madagascariensis]|uniref:Uncharacterized protein n=1 Tax=Trichonephila inaurata madagascariensis TaxID=2747483 RepID=A0A8X6MGF2_9ARAC|nr:hypothetical protein TNIN_492841 [Trichonephila inaurata madagascariensis]
MAFKENINFTEQNNLPLYTTFDVFGHLLLLSLLNESSTHNLPQRKRSSATSVIAGSRKWFGEYPTRLENAKESGPKSFLPTNYTGRPTFRTRMDGNHFERYWKLTSQFESGLFEIIELLCVVRNGEKRNFKEMRLDEC